MDAVRIGCGEVQGVIGAEREADHRQEAAGRANPIAEEGGCLGDLGFGLEVACVEGPAEGFGGGDRVCNLAVVEVRGESRETGFGEPGAEGFYRRVQAPPGVQDQYRKSISGGGDGEKTERLRLVHGGYYIEFFSDEIEATLGTRLMTGFLARAAHRAGRHAAAGNGRAG